MAAPLSADTASAPSSPAHAANNKAATDDAATDTTHLTPLPPPPPPPLSLHDELPPPLPKKPTLAELEAAPKALPGDVPGVAYARGSGKGRNACCNVVLSRWVYGIAANFTSMACAGSFFGWANMSGMLQRDGWFADTCDNGGSGDTTCSAQALALNNVYNVAAICSFISPTLVGIVLDRVSPRAAMRLTASIFTAGGVALLLADAYRSVAALYLAFIAFGISASAMILPLYNYANLFPGYEGLALGLIGGSFDAGSLVYYVMSVLRDAGASLQPLALAYLVGPIFVLLLTVTFLWRPIVFFPVSDSIAYQAALSAARDAPVAPVEVSVAEVAAEAPADVDVGMSSPHLSTLHEGGDDATATLPLPPPPSSSIHPVAVDLKALPLLRQILSPEWLAYAGFFVYNMLRYNMYIGTIDTQLTSMGQKDGEYTKIFGIVAPLGFFFQFVVGPLLDRAGLVTTMTAQWALAVLLSALNLVHDLDVQVVTFVAFAFFRAFHFSNMSTYMARTFGYATMGSTVGLVVLAGGLVSLLQSALLLWAFAAPGATDERGNFTPPNTLLLVAAVLSGAFPAWYWWRRRRIAAADKAAASADTSLPAVVAPDHPSAPSAPPAAADAADAAAATVPPPSSL